jgi:hypothetical protein
VEEGRVILHWLNVEIWGPMWPNVFSPNLWTLVAVLAHLAVTLAQRERQHLDMKKHVTNTANESEAK